MRLGSGPGECNRPRPFDIDTVLQHAQLTIAQACRALDLDRQQIYRWRDYGLTVDQADDLATFLGFHPTEIWPDWYEVVASLAVPLAEPA